MSVGDFAGERMHLVLAVYSVFAKSEYMSQREFVVLGLSPGLLKANSFLLSWGVLDVG